MGLREEKVVIGHDLVTRFNGNNPKGGRESRRPALFEAYGKKKKIIEWRKAKAWTRYQERKYEEEYLNA